MRYFVCVMVVMLGCDGAPAGSSPDLAATSDSDELVESLSFSTTNVGQSTTAMLRIVNQGNADSGAITVAIGGSAATDFMLADGTDCDGAVLSAGASCHIAIAFRPMAAGMRDASLVVTAEPGGTATVRLEGDALLPALTFNPGTVELGMQEIGKGLQHAVELRNESDAAVPIDSIAVTGAGYSLGIDTCGVTLAPGGACDITLSIAPQQLGAQNGELVVSTEGQQYTAPLRMRGGRRLTVTKEGTGIGTVTSSPSGIDCGAICTGLFEGDVMLTATANAGSQLVSWSGVPGCGSNATCTVPADASPLQVGASFLLAGSSTIQVVMTGDGGDVLVSRGDTEWPGVRCASSCSVPAEPGQRIWINAATTSIYGGISGACTATPATGDQTTGEGYCSFIAPVGTSTVTATFTKDPKEEWTRLVSPFDEFVVAAFDADDNLVAASPKLLVKLSPAGATLWSQARTDIRSLRAGPDRTIYFMTATELVKLDAAGATLWTRPLVGTCSYYRYLNCLAVGPVGEVVVNSSTKLARWDAAGTQSWVHDLPRPGGYGVAIDGQGIISAEQESAIDPEYMAAIRYDAAGTSLGTLDPLSNQYHGMLAVDSSGGVIATSSGHGWVYLDTPSFSRDVDVLNVGAYTENGVAVAGTGDIAWAYWPEDSPGTPSAWYITRFTRTGSERWTHFRRIASDTTSGQTGTTMHNLAASPTGRIAVVGRYYGTASGFSWIQSFRP